jgi:hypothetical protein
MYDKQKEEHINKGLFHTSCLSAEGCGELAHIVYPSDRYPFLTPSLDGYDVCTSLTRAKGKDYERGLEIDTPQGS